MIRPALLFYVRERIAQYRVVTPDDVNHALEALLKQPPIRMQIDTARKLYREADELMEEISRGGSPGYGMASKRDSF